MPKLILLDLDGVQVFRDKDLHYQSCAQLLYDSGFNVTPEEYGRAFKEFGVQYSLGRYSSDAQFYKLLMESLGVQFNLRLAKELHNIYYQCFGLYPQVPGVIIKLRKRYPLFLLSNHINHWVDFILSKFRLKGIYQYQIISQSAGYRKPNPEIFKMALRLSSVSPKDCVLFDDKQENVAAAQKLGMDARIVDPSQGLTIENVSDLLG